MPSSTESRLDPDLFRKTIDSMDSKADYVDIRINESINNIIVMKDGKIQEIRSGTDFGGSVRVLKNGSWGFAYTTQISRLDDMAESALKLAKSLKSDVD